MRNYGATRPTSPDSPHVQTDPLAAPPAAWEQPRGEEQKVHVAWPPMWWLTAFLSLFDAAGLFLFAMGIFCFASGVPGGGVFIMVFYSAWAGGLTFIVYMVDPGAVHTSLTDAGDIDDALMAAKLDALREAPPQIVLHGQASHEESTGTGEDRRTSTKVTFSKNWHLKYARWRDVSGTATGLESYGRAVLTVQVDIVDADEATARARKGATQSICRYINAAHHDFSVTCSQTGQVEAEGFRVHGDRQVLTYSPGEKTPFWMSQDLYFVACFCSLGTVYRILFAIGNPHVVYHLRKEISVVERP